MSKIFLINIKNTKEDFSKAFWFIKKLENNEKIINEWDCDHISTVTVNPSLCDKASTSKNLFKKMMSYSEIYYEQRIAITNENSLTLDDDDYFYFRVENNLNTDIVNLHYFYLIEKRIKQYCMMGIFTNIRTEQRMIKERMTASFLICQKENFAAYNVDYKVVEYKPQSQTTQKCKYCISLIPNNLENVFFLRNMNNNFVKTPCELDDKGLSVSKRFFPLLKIDNEKNYNILASNAKHIVGESLFLRNNKSPLVLNDVLYQLAAKDTTIQWNDENTLADLFKKGERLSFVECDFVKEILILFCKNCYQSIYQGKTREEKLKIKKYVKAAIEETSLLALCIFLSFWSSMKTTVSTNIRLDALLMDSEDYADGLLQLLENAIKHAEGGIFCFRIHNTNFDSKTNSIEYLKKHYPNTEENKYYLEALVSDYNRDYDILKSFIKNLKSDRDKDDSSKEYYISDIQLQEAENNFSIADLFDYNKNSKTQSFWKEFYNNSKNLTSHYGLLVFERLVEFAGGTFSVSSSRRHIINEKDIYSNTSFTTQKPEDKVHIPGTQYKILLPIEIKQSTQETGLNYTLKTDSATKAWERFWVSTNTYSSLLDCNMERSLDVCDELINPNLKSAKIREVLENILDDYGKHVIKNLDYEIMCFDVKGISMPISAEILSKTFIALLCDENIKTKYFAFKNASDQFMNTFIRMFSLLYLKSGQRDLMKNRQVYICSNAAEKEVLFYDDMLTKSLIATKNITILGKGKPTREFRFLERQAEKALEERYNNCDSICPLPFDVLIDGVFRDKVKNDLEKDIQEDEFGCCLKNVHMRVGSKIHIHGNYYEASLLFSNSNYTSRFSYYIFDRVKEKIQETTSRDKKTKIVLVGYEAYSEALIIELTKTININLNSDEKLDVDYLIYYENNRTRPFSHWNRVAPSMDTKFIIIVPVGSTLTTHEKIVADLYRQIDSSGKSFSQENILAHFAVILIRNSNKDDDETGCREIERNFWKKACFEGSDNHIIYNDSGIGANGRIDFFVSVENEWQLPNECRYCFPSKEYMTQEEPLIQSNRASVIPMTMYGKERSKCIAKPLYSYSDSEKMLAPLKSNLCSGHFVRNKGNHFRFYFKTDRIMNEILKTQEKEFDNWLKEIDGLIETSSNQNVVFNFIVAPLHKTNAQFVNIINSRINAKQIIWLDTKKEYRDNIKAKYSNLTTLAQNMMNSYSAEDVHLHFHFVDDTITSGFTINRAKTLLQSLFYDLDCLGENNVHVHLFSSVILLLNRCSPHTKQGFVSLDRFKSYINLNVSVMRNHSDACVPCKMHCNFSNKMKKGSSTNLLSEFSAEIGNDYEQKDEAEYDKSECYLAKKRTTISKLSDVYRLNGFYNLIASHRLNCILDSLGGRKNDSNTIEKIIWTELFGICSDAISKKISVEKSWYRLSALLIAISRPFLTYRHSVLKASTKVLLELFQCFLFSTAKKSDSKHKESYITFLNNIIRTDGELHFNFIILLLTCLVNVNSTIIIRPFVINKLFDYMETNKLDDEKFIHEYAFCVKQLLELSGKDNLSVWLEKMLKTNTEPFPPRTKLSTINNKNLVHKNKFLQLLVLENTLPIRDALTECDKEIQSNCAERTEIIIDTLNQYYCKNYRDFANIEYSELEFVTHCSNTFLPMLNLYEHLVKKPNCDEANYYNTFIQQIKQVLFANNVILMIQTGTRVDRLYPDKKFFGELNSTEAIIEATVNSFANGNTSVNSIGETLFWERMNGSIFGIIKLNNTSEESDFPIWYIAFDCDSNNFADEFQFIYQTRNLLAMRWLIVNRLNEDFNNNIIGKFLDYKDEFQKLGTDKSGSHTPYQELFEAFNGLKDMVSKFDGLIAKTSQSKYVDDDTGKMYSYFANQFKLIADSLISKWYVHSILKTFPVNMDPHIIGMNHPKPLEYFERVLTILRYSCADNSGTPVCCNPNITWDIEWKSVMFSAPHNCSYMWCCAFQSLIFNALHHGYNFESSDGKDVADVYVKYSEGKFEIRNRMKENDSIDRESVTLSALKYFFDSYYGKDAFYYSVEKRKDGANDFVVYLPCVERRNLDENFSH